MKGGGKNGIDGLSYMCEDLEKMIIVSYNGKYQKSSQKTMEIKTCGNQGK